MTFFAPFDLISSVSICRDEFRELLPMEEFRTFGTAVPLLIASGQAPDGQTHAVLKDPARGFVGKPYALKATLRWYGKRLIGPANSDKVHRQKTACGPDRRGHQAGRPRPVIL